MSWEPRLGWGGISVVILSLEYTSTSAVFQAFLRHGYVTSEHNAAKCIEGRFLLLLQDWMTLVRSGSYCIIPCPDTVFLLCNLGRDVLG